MSIMLTGTLSVQRISGTHGNFSVGKLECEVGVLNIKDPQLDQYETGKYQGRFKVERIYPHGYMARTGCFIVEVRAVVDEYIIHSDEPDVLDTEVALKEIDPLEAQTERPMATAVAPTKPPRESAVARPQRPPSTVAPSPRRPPAPINTPPAHEAGSAQPARHDQTFEDDPMIALFGELWPLGDVVRLDPTTIRSDAENHRKRCAYLDKMGYAFKPRAQAWVKEPVPVAEETLL